VVLGKQYVPLGWVTRPITYRDVSNYRTKTLTFEVVDFSGPYHVILGQLCYVKFMANTSYAYLKLKIPRPTGIITVEAKTQRALDCEQDNIELATAAFTMTEQRELSLWIPMAPPSLAMPMVSSVLKMDEDANAIQINDGDPAKTMQIRACSDPN
jgi:hypothetical protein